MKDLRVMTGGQPMNKLKVALIPACEPGGALSASSGHFFLTRQS